MSTPDAWAEDLLGYKEIGSTFSKLIGSIDDAKVISIEAGFGVGKTFFRKAWSQQLKYAGETVIELDVLQSDHSGDPLITLLGALAGELPLEEKNKFQEAASTLKKLGSVFMRTGTRAVLRTGADEFFDIFENLAIEELGDFNALVGAVKKFGDEMSKAAANIIATQMAAEKVRTQELPEQLKALRAALTDTQEAKNVIIIVDELDRCHPDFAISFLEATKVVFNQPGFVFCLMVNADYLENLAKHRFGTGSNDEKYLDKFVDIRLRLAPTPEARRTAAEEIAIKLPLTTPFAEDEAFSVERAAELAGQIATDNAISMRTIKRTLFKVEIALRCYADHRIDAPLLVALAFKVHRVDVAKYLPRVSLTPKNATTLLGRSDTKRYRSMDDERENDVRIYRVISEKYPELLKLSPEQCGAPPLDQNRSYKVWAPVLRHLAPTYIPDHQNMLDMVAALIVGDDGTAK